MNDGSFATLHNMMRVIRAAFGGFVVIAAALTLSTTGFAAPDEGTSSTGAYVLSKIYQSASARLARGDLDGAIDALNLVVDVGPGVTEAQISRDLALTLRDFAGRANVLPQIQRLEATAPNDPMVRMLAVFANPSLSQLRGDGALYVTTAGAQQLRAAAGDMNTYVSARNGRYAAQFLTSGQASGDPAFPVRYANFGSMIGNGGKIALPQWGESIPFGELFILTVNDSRFNPYGQRLIARLQNGLKSLQQNQVSISRMIQKVQQVRAQIQTGDSKQRKAAVATLDELTTELDSVRQSSQQMVAQLRIILDNVDARSDARIAQNRRTIQEQEEQIARLHSLTRALRADVSKEQQTLHVQQVAVSKARGDYMELVAKIKAGQGELNSLQGKLANAQSRLASSQHASTGLEQSVRQHNDEIAAIKAREDALRQQQQAAAKLEALQQQQAAATADLARIQSQVRAAQTAGQGDLASLQQQRDALQAKVKTLAADVQAGQVGQQRAEATKHELDQLVSRKNAVEQQMVSEQARLAQVQAERHQLLQEVDRLHAEQDRSQAEQTRLAKEIRGIDFGHYYALVIGNDEYREWPRLRTAVNDARDLADVLSRKYGFRVQLLTNATKAQILDAINGYIAQLGSSDNLLVYYAGHGVMANNVGYWVPVDAESTQVAGRIAHPEELVGHDELISAMQKMKAKEVMVLADSCFSGGLAAMAMEAPRTELADNRRLSPVRTRGLRIVDQDGQVPVKAIEGTVVRIDMPDRDVAALSHWAVTPARVVLTSGGLEPVADQMRPGDRHSVFAAAVLSALRRNTGLLKSLDLTSAVEDQVVRSAGSLSQRGGHVAAGFVQTPTYNNLMGYSGQFLFVAQN